jgi:hypothetical protein
VSKHARGRFGRASCQRYAINTNLIHKWLRDPQFAPVPEIFEKQVAGTPCFLPVEIVDRPGANDTAPGLAPSSAQSTIEIGPVAVWCRSFDSIYCNKGDELRD